MGDDYKFTESQKNEIYNKYLKPLKLKISQIMLYDTKSAVEFLQKYNELIENTPDAELMDKITELEMQLASYEKGEGKQKSFNEKRKIIIGQIEELEQTSDNLSFEDFEQEVANLTARYRENLKNYEFDDRDAIEEKLYQVKAKLIMRQVKEQYPERIELSPEDEMGLMVYISKELNRLGQNKNPKAKSYVERVKYNIMGGMEALHNSETWKLLSYAQRENFIGEEQKAQKIAGTSVTPQTNALAVVKNTNRGNFLQTISRMFSKEPKLPLQVSDLKKINIDWLAQYIPQEMAEDLETKKLKEEGKNPEKRYVPNSKKVIYEVIGSIRGIVWNSTEKTFEKDDGKYMYIDKNGNKKIQKYICSNIGTSLTLYTEDYIILTRGILPKKLHYNDCLTYADFLDNIFQTNIKQKLLQEVEEFVNNFGFNRDNENIFLKHCKVYKELNNSLARLWNEYSKNKLNFFIKENNRRTNFYSEQRRKQEMSDKQIESRSEQAQDKSFRQSMVVTPKQIIDVSARSEIRVINHELDESTTNRVEEDGKKSEEQEME